jgi:superfamily II DNA or RNA helicase
VTVAEYLARHPEISQASEKLFVEEFLYPLLGDAIDEICPQMLFIDRSGRGRKIDFAHDDGTAKVALEVNGETYHAEGIIPNEMFDDNLYRQNEILARGFALIRFSYSQLQAQAWRPLVMDSLREFFAAHAPKLLRQYKVTPNQPQREALESLEFFRDKRSWERGVVIMPMGTGKTILSALDAAAVGKRVLFIVHRLDLLKQSAEAYAMVHPTWTIGRLTGEERSNVLTADVLFASKDTLRQPEVLRSFSRSHFNYVVIDEVHHGQTPTYREIIKYFKPKFMLGITGTPDRADRLDIFELFDYQKVFEMTLADAIEKGFLVPYTYVGLTDDVDYRTIRYQNNRYRVDDLDRLLIVPKRNEAIVREYLKYSAGDKAVGFCVSIKHADRMAEVFRSHGIQADALHSNAADRDLILQRFRDNLIQVVFTVDLFNEGIDIPNIRTLLFLRPTESKTVFMQQLGRGLRLCAGKDRTLVLDFIGNYNRASQVRKFLAKDVAVTSKTENGRTRKKLQFSYVPGCDVSFDPRVEEMLNEQDASVAEVTQQDLKEAYFVLAESLGRKPTRDDLDRDGEFRASAYVGAFGSWLGFLRDIGEYTEASYHYPQGVHVGHLLSILKYFGSDKRAGTHFADKYVRMRGGYDDGRLGIYQRQVKYKLQGAMELGLMTDDRKYPSDKLIPLELTPLGRDLYSALTRMLDATNLRFKNGGDGVPSTAMAQSDSEYVQLLRQELGRNKKARKAALAAILSMPAAQQMLKFLYRVVRGPVTTKGDVYEQFFQAPFVKQFCDQEGIEEPSQEGARRRLPFLLSLVDVLGVMEMDQSDLKVTKLLLTPDILASESERDRSVLNAVLKDIEAVWPGSATQARPETLLLGRELFGPTFLTQNYYLKELEVAETNG